MDEKVVLASTSVVALALGMGVGVSPAHADLVVTDFSSADMATFTADGAVNFGPSGDPNGFTAQYGAGPIAGGLTLTGNDGNTVAVTTADCTVNCKLQTLNPGELVDGSLNYASSGAFDTYVKCSPFAYCDVNDGNYYFGLDDTAASPDPFGFLEITVADDDASLDGYAFETGTDSAPVPGSVPEPASMSLFAVGAAAVLAARRRRRAAMR